MVNHVEKAKELLEKLIQLKDVNEIQKKKHIKCLEKTISGKITGDPIIQFMRNAECIAAAFNFIDSNGAETFEQLCMSTSKSKLIPLFKKFQKTFTDSEYWENLGYVYVMQDFEKIDYSMLKKLFSSKRTKRAHLMSQEEQDFLKSLPDEIVIFRGGDVMELKKGFGISWSLNKQVAEKFAKNKRIQTGQEMTVHEKVISKKDVIAYLNSRCEEEIIYLG